MSLRDDLLEPFLLEARDGIGRGRRDLAQLAARAGDRAALDSLFRAVHTLKGSTALFDLPALTRLLHAAETALDDARASEALGPDVADLLERVLDTAESWADALERGDELGPSLAEATRSLTERLAGGGQQAKATAESAPTPAWAAALAADAGASGAVVAIRYAPAPEAYFRGDDPLQVMRSLPGLLTLSVLADEPVDAAAYDPFRCTLRFAALSQASLEEVQAATRFVADQVELAIVEGAAATASAGVQIRSLHVEASRLDDVAALVDELVVAKNALAYETRKLLAGREGGGREILAREAVLERLVGEIHAAVTGLRLTPLAQLFSRFPRRTREIADDLGKPVGLRTAGEEVALDKSIVEGLFEPLLHLVRNAIDHGVEDAVTRRAAGKPERATISITAAASGRDVVVEVADDGGGVDVAATRRVAVSRGLMDRDAAEALSDQAAAELVFATGFSTAAAVSVLSGRGVGMDAVRTAVTRLGGQVALINRPGLGLRVRLTLPAQVKLQKILVVRSGVERFGVPLEAIREMHRVRRQEVTPVRAGRAYVRHDNVIPLVRLSDLVGVHDDGEADVFPVLNVAAGGERIGVQVDAIEERLETPMRPMSGLMAAHPGVLGTVLQGDGQVLLVLDLAELAA